GFRGAFFVGCLEVVNRPDSRWSGLETYAAWPRLSAHEQVEGPGLGAEGVVAAALDDLAVDVEAGARSHPHADDVAADVDHVGLVLELAAAQGEGDARQDQARAGGD